MNKNKKANGKFKNELPFAMFVYTKKDSEEMIDFKHIITEIVSDRIQEKLK